jgi:hypothetical protein
VSSVNGGNQMFRSLANQRGNPEQISPGGFQSLKGFGLSQNTTSPLHAFNK